VSQSLEILPIRVDNHQPGGRACWLVGWTEAERDPFFSCAALTLNDMASLLRNSGRAISRRISTESPLVAELGWV
jgi:hypothetical protein